MGEGLGDGNCSPTADSDGTLLGWLDNVAASEPSYVPTVEKCEVASIPDGVDNWDVPKKIPVSWNCVNIPQSWSGLHEEEARIVEHEAPLMPPPGLGPPGCMGPPGHFIANVTPPLSVCTSLGPPGQFGPPGCLG